MVTYELLYLTPLQDVETSRAAIRERVTKLIQTSGGSVVAARDVARQRLSYPIKQQQAGEYALIEFTAPGGQIISEIQRELRLSPDILRLAVTIKSGRARTVGAQIEAMERAKARKDATEIATAERATVAEPQPIEDLDKKLEEILGKEMV